MNKLLKLCMLRKETPIATRSRENRTVCVACWGSYGEKEVTKDDFYCEEDGFRISRKI